MQERGANLSGLFVELQSSVERLSHLLEEVEELSSDWISLHHHQTGGGRVLWRGQFPGFESVVAAIERRGAVCEQS
jgi:hypothetical protein